MKKDPSPASDLEATLCGPCLVLNEKDAIVLTPAALAEDLFTHLRTAGVSCSLRQGNGPCRVIDLGNPSDLEEKRIRSLFASWRAAEGRSDRSLVWYAVLVLVIVALWVQTLIEEW